SRIQTSRTETCAQERCHCEHNDVIDKKGREDAADCNRQSQETERPARLTRYPHGCGIVEAACSNPCGKHHQASEKEQGRKMNCACYLVGRYCTCGNDNDRGDHCDA